MTSYISASYFRQRVIKLSQRLLWRICYMLVFCCCVTANPVHAQVETLDEALLKDIDTFVETERFAANIPGVAIAVLQEGHALHVRGFGHDGRGNAINVDTPFPIGSLTKSFTALLVRQAIEDGQLKADAPLQQYLPWFRVSDLESSARITLRHLLNQTSGLSRADGIAPLLQGSTASIEELSRGLGSISLNRSVGESFEYSNLNFVLLGAVLQRVTGQSWQHLIQTKVLQPLQMTNSYSDYDAARLGGMTALHRMWFGRPVAQHLSLLPGFAPTGSLVASASDMAQYMQMLLSGGVSPAGHLLSEQSVAQLLAPSSPSGSSKLLSSDFSFRYAEGWFVGSFGAAQQARWHLGYLASFAAWMVLLPDSKTAVVVLINANTELPFNEVNAVMSRLPIGVVNLLIGQPVPQGPSLPEAYQPFNAAAALCVVIAAALALWVLRTRHNRWSFLMALLAIGLFIALDRMGLSATILYAFAPDLALVVVTVAVFLCLPALLRIAVWAKHALPHNKREE